MKKRDAYIDFASFVKQRLEKRGKTFNLESIKTVEQVKTISKEAPVIPT